MGFEGGQMPLYRRLPKIGFSNHDFKQTYQVVNVGALEHLVVEGPIGPAELRRAGLIRKVADPVKILGEGELTRSVVVRAHRFSQAALDKIGRAGGRAEVI
jgi:large subunit ribosomal protein L15